MTNTTSSSANRPVTDKREPHADRHDLAAEGRTERGHVRPAGGAIEPVPGDPRTEPVASATESHVAGRVGPPTIAQDATADQHAPEGVEQIEPGQVMPATTVAEGGPLLVDSAAIVPDADRETVHVTE